jgi:hypothetical protein
MIFRKVKKRDKLVLLLKTSSNRLHVLVGLDQASTIVRGQLDKTNDGRTEDRVGVEVVDKSAGDTKEQKLKNSSSNPAPDQTKVRSLSGRTDKAQNHDAVQQGVGGDEVPGVDPVGSRVVNMEARGDDRLHRPVVAQVHWNADANRNVQGINPVHDHQADPVDGLEDRGQSGGLRSRHCWLECFLLKQKRQSVKCVIR